MKKHSATAPDVKVAYDYYPFGMNLPGRVNSTDDYRFGFTGHEKVDEINGNGNSYVTDARLYDSRLGIWKSVDPLFIKYPEWSSYNYCGNNPIRHIDPDGKDYVLSIDKENSIATVHATYYASSQDVASAQQAADFWNEQSGNFKYQTKDGNYSVQFALIVAEVGIDDDASINVNQLVKGLETADKSGGSNVYRVVADSDLDSNKNGSTVQGNFVTVKDSRKDTETGAHEIGHTLGLTHSSTGIMTPSSSDENRNNTVNTSGLKKLFSYPLKGKTNFEDRAKAGKGKVQYLSSPRDYELQNTTLSPKGKIKETE